jgi:membrane AbrB-like protein
VRKWAGAFAAIFVAGWLLDAAGLPASYLFGALSVGLVVAIRWPGALAAPPVAFRACQAVTGVALGALVRSDALEAAADAWVAVTLVSLATLALSLACGIGLARFTSLDRPTAALGMVAGGASGIVAMAGELRADDRLVAFMQYLRVLVVVMATPLLMTLAFPGHHAGSPDDGAGVLGDLEGWALTIALAPLGVLVARYTRLPAGVLLGPMLVTAAVGLWLPDGFAVPPVLREAAFAGIGLQVGLRFTVATVRQVGSLVGPVLACVVGLMVACFGLAFLLDVATSATLLDAYLATTPGGLLAVLAAAFGSGADTTFVLAVQTLRILVMVLLAPAMVRILVRGAWGGPSRWRDRRS